MNGVDSEEETSHSTLPSPKACAPPQVEYEKRCDGMQGSACGAEA